MNYKKDTLASKQRRRVLSSDLCFLNSIFSQKDCRHSSKKKRKVSTMILLCAIEIHPSYPPLLKERFDDKIQLGHSIDTKLSGQDASDHKHFFKTILCTYF